MAFEDFKDAGQRQALNRERSVRIQSSPISRFEVVEVSFDVPNQDVDIKHTLHPNDPEDISYIVVKQSAPAVVAQDQTGTRKPWQRDHIWLRASRPTDAIILLYLPSGQPPPRLPQTASTVVADVAGIALTIDGQGSPITTGYKNAIRVPFACELTSATLLSCDEAITSGSISIDVWKDTYANYPPTLADSITGGNVPAIVGGIKGEIPTLTGWTTTVNPGDVLAFDVVSVTDLIRVTMILAINKT